MYLYMVYFIVVLICKTIFSDLCRALKNSAVINGSTFTETLSWFVNKIL